MAFDLLVSVICTICAAVASLVAAASLRKASALTPMSFDSRSSLNGARSTPAVVAFRI